MPRYYVTKWALARGIVSVEAAKPETPRHCHVSRVWICVPGQRYGVPLFIDREAFLKLEDARADVRSQFETALKRATEQVAYCKKGLDLIDAGQLSVHKDVQALNQCRAFQGLEVHLDEAPIVNPKRLQKEEPPMSKERLENPGGPRCVDVTFGVNHQALAILHFLAGEPALAARKRALPYQPRVDTFPWYNGAENGVALVIYANEEARGRCRIIVFGEQAETDDLFIEHWDQFEPPFSAPNVEQRHATLVSGEDTAAVKTLKFKAGAISDVAGQVLSLLNQFVAKPR